jgi:hypothetical protein
VIPRERRVRDGSSSVVGTRKEGMICAVLRFPGSSCSTQEDEAGNDRSATTYARANSMGKARVAISAVVVGLAIGSTGVASAVPRAVGECSPAFVGMDIQTVIDTIAAPDFNPQAFFDEDGNGDDRLCIKIIPNEGGPPQFDPAFVFIDNKI